MTVFLVYFKYLKNYIGGGECLVRKSKMPCNMKRLQENNIIRRVGAAKNGHWEIVEEKDES